MPGELLIGTRRRSADANGSSERVYGFCVANARSGRAVRACGQNEQ